jgi:hypothetical protein
MESKIVKKSEAHRNNWWAFHLELRRLLIMRGSYGVDFVLEDSG